MTRDEFGDALDAGQAIYKPRGADAITRAARTRDRMGGRASVYTMMVIKGDDVRSRYFAGHNLHDAETRAGLWLAQRQSFSEET